jgi:hypothetical protein
MSQTKLLVLFNHLSGVEKREFSRYIASDYFNKRDDLQALWSYLLYEVGPAGGVFQKEKAFEAVFPGEPFDEAKLRYPMSWLVKSIEYFLAMRRFEKNESEQALHLANAFREKNLEKPFHHAIRQAENLLEEQVKDQEYHYARYRIELEKYAISIAEKRTVSNNLAEVGRSLDAFLLAAKLKQSCLQLAHQSVYQIDYDDTFLPGLLQFLQGSSFLEIPAIGLYYHCYLAMTKGDEGQFRQFRELLELHSGEFTKDEMRDLWLLAINFCIKRLNTGGRAYVLEAFDLYRSGIAQGILLEQGVLGRFAYKNTVALGLTLGQTDWVHNFIETYRPALEAAHRENFYRYNLARYFFSIKQYGQAMELLVLVGDSDLLLNLDAKLMLLKMYYELGEFDALESLLTAMKTFIRRRKELGYQKNHYLGIIRFTQKLMALPPNDRAARELLRSEIENAEGLPEKEWLLGQVFLAN